MYHYNKDDFDPPAPHDHVTISFPQGLFDATIQEISGVPMIIDTGGDISCIPKWVISDIEKQVGEDLPFEMEEGLVDFNGRSDNYKKYLLIIESKWLDEPILVDFIVVDSKRGVIGRDILNKFHVTFNGPGLIWNKLS